MSTRCPKCDTQYRVDEDMLLKANCLAHCYRCGALFTVIGKHAAEIETADIELMISALRLDQRSEIPASVPQAPRPQAPRPQAPRPEAPRREVPGLREPDRAEDAATHKPSTIERSAGTNTSPAASDNIEDDHQHTELPFEMPVDLEPLLPSPDAALDVEDTLYEKRSRRGLWYGLLTTCLLVALGLQLAWQHREELLARYPVLERLCEHVTCRPSVIRAPERFRILQRDIKPTANEPDSLTLTASFRNIASIAQVLPDIQLSLLDTDGSVLIRRRLSPADYLYPAPADQAAVAPGEVITIAVDFKDPGYVATGFIIDFL